MPEHHVVLSADAALAQINERLLYNRCGGMLAIGRLPPACWISAWPRCTASSKSITLSELSRPSFLGSMAAPTYSRLVDNPCFGTLQGGLRPDNGCELDAHVAEDSSVH